MFEVCIKLSLASLRLICKRLIVSNRLHLSMLREKHRIILHPEQVMNLHKERAGLGKLLICKAHNNQGSLQLAHAGRHRIHSHEIDEVRKYLQRSPSPISLPKAG